MDIAVLLAELEYDSQQKIVSGILKEALQDDANVYIFTCDIKAEATKEYDDGEHNVFSLVQLDAYDGIIMHGDSLCKRELVDALAREIEASNVPAVSFNTKYPGFMCVESENFYGIYQMVNHLVKHHGARKINYISGPKRNSDAQDRMDAYRIALGENGIPYEESRVYYGDWSPVSGTAAMEHFMQEAVMPDAIVAANDEMALGAIAVLEKLGFAVPEDVLVTGYDDAAAGKYYYPRLSTVRRPEEEMGELAYRMLQTKRRGEPTEESRSLMCQPVYAGSCGCVERHPEDTRILRKRYVKEKNYVSFFSNIVRFSAADFTGVESCEALCRVIADYAQRMNLQEFYLCMCEEEEDADLEAFYARNKEFGKRTEYTDNMTIPIMRRDGVFSGYGSFKRNGLLPREFTEGRRGTFYTIVPLHYQGYCYGYFVLVNNRLQIDSALFQMFIMNINNALENIRGKRLLNKVVSQLNKKLS